MKKNKEVDESTPTGNLPHMDWAAEHGAASKPKQEGGVKRREKVPDRPNLSISLWSIVKNSIGKDLTRIPVPVNFSEPLSMLQRLVEDFEYSDILHQAAQVEDDCEQVC